MAKYEDYLAKRKTGLGAGLTEEIVEAQEHTVQRQETQTTGFEMPEQFRDKSKEDVVTDYMELQKSHSRQGNALGDLRRTVDTLLLSDDPLGTPGKQEPELKPVTVDELYESPDDVIRQVARDESSSQLDETRRQLAELKYNIQYDKFQTKHGDWRDVVETPKFQNWVSDSSYRQRMWEAANKYDFDAAHDLLDAYGDFVGVVDTKQDAERTEQLAAAGLESASAGADLSDSTETYSRAKLMEARIAAKTGNREASDWLKENNPAITQAYADGRVTD